MKNILFKLVLFIALIIGASESKAQSSIDIGNEWDQTIGGVIAWDGKKMRTTMYSDPSGGTMIFKIICDRQVEGVCFYADNGSSDTLHKKSFRGILPSGVINSSIPELKLRDENGQVLHTGKLHSYWNNMIIGQPVTTREYRFYFE